MMKILQLGICAAALTLASLAHGVTTFDDVVTPDILFGSGNANGGFTVDREGSVELGLRGKLRFPPSNVFNSNGDGTYTFKAGVGVGPGSQADDPVWNFEWSVNTDYNSTTGDTLSDFTYLLEIDYDPGAGTNFLAWDHISSPTAPIPFTAPANPGYYDHSIGTNGTVNGGGTEANSAGTYAPLVAGNNVAQNSWRLSFFNQAPFAFDPNATGTYDVRLTALSGMTVVAQVTIQILVDGNVTPDILFGSGNANGGFTLDRTASVELGLRGKLRFPPSNVFNSNFDGTYTFVRGVGVGPGSQPDDPVWNFEWSVNTDYNAMTGATIDDFTYLLEIDYDPGAGTNFLAWDHITSPTAPIPWATPANPGFYDHSFGTNGTPNGGGTEATSAATYAPLVTTNNVAQNSWRLSFFNQPPFAFNPNAIGRYDIRLTAFSGMAVAAQVDIQVNVVVSATCTMDSDCSDGLACNGMETCNLATNQCDFGTSVVCSGTCLTGTCLEPSGACQVAANGVLCSDGLECTVSDTCQGGVCTPGPGGDADGDGDCDAEEAGCGCNGSDGNEICALPNRLVGFAGSGSGEVLLNWHTPTVRRVIVATDPSCQQSGVCGTAGRCTAGQVNDLCTSNSDCDLAPNTCRMIVNYADVGDLSFVFAKVSRTDQTPLFLPATPGCSRKIDVPLDPSRSSNPVRTKAEGTIDGRLRRDRDNIVYR